MTIKTPIYVTRDEKLLMTNDNCFNVQKYIITSGSLQLS